ncbi:hypothetical protein BDF22DRAFT_511167 [Syncephalis plumigaleata]|nr:hypothetical protein BDF22DRAFT_511167 [Syncephalis plumigaleata]
MTLSIKLVITKLVWIIGLTSIISDVTMASLMPKKNQLTLEGLLTLDRNSDALLKYGLQLDEKFAIKRGLLRASAQWGSYKVDIFCGDEDKDNPEDRSLQVYKTIMIMTIVNRVLSIKASCKRSSIPSRPITCGD